jgi:hypothetical protein
MSTQSQQGKASDFACEFAQMFRDAGIPCPDPVTK